MTLSNKEIVRRFINGSESGFANQMQIVTGELSHDGEMIVAEGETALIGYGWAVYARRTANGRVNIFNGWRGYSNTTSRHLSLLSQETGPNAITSDRKPQMQPEP